MRHKNCLLAGCQRRTCLPGFVTEHETDRPWQREMKPEETSPSRGSYPNAEVADGIFREASDWPLWKAERPPLEAAVPVLAPVLNSCIQLLARNVNNE